MTNYHGHLPRWLTHSPRHRLPDRRQGDATVNELAEPFDVTVQNISKHIRVPRMPGYQPNTRGTNVVQSTSARCST